jgi:(p)ppGpp synthase/HD superfamily hydrolase
MAAETVAVYVPLANRLGVWSFKAELEDLCLKHTEPEKFAAIQVRVSSFCSSFCSGLCGV